MVEHASGPREPILTPAFGWLTAAHLLQAFGYSSMILLPSYLDHLGASRGEIGAIMAASAIGGLASRPAVGWALDAWGRKPTLAAGTVVMTLGMLLVGLIDDIGWLAYAVRVVFGIGMGACFTGYFTLAADLVPVSRRTEGLALFGVSGLLPLALNPFAGRLGILGADVRWFLPMVGVVIGSSLLALTRVPERWAPRAPRRVFGPDVLLALRHRALWSVWLADVVFSGMVALFMSFSLVVATDRGVSSPADMWLAYALGAISVRLFGGSLPDRVGPSRLLPPALLSYVAGVLLVAWSSSSGGFALAGLLAGVGHGYCFPILTAQVVTRSPESLRGSALAMFTGIWDLTKLLLPPAFGMIADLWGDVAMLQLTAGAAVFGLGLWALLERGALTGATSSGHLEHPSVR